MVSMPAALPHSSSESVANSGCCCSPAFTQTSHRPARCIRRPFAAPPATNQRPAAVVQAQAPQAVVDQQPQLSRLCQGFLPPLPEKPTTLEQLGDGLWVLRQPFLSSTSYMSATCNSFVVALPDSDDLMVISPVSQTEEAQYLQGQIPGRVKHIVCHSVSPEHWLYATQLIRQWPDATVWACPGIAETSSLLGKLPGMTDAWGTMLKEVRRSDGSPVDVRVVRDGEQPPELSALGVTFLCFESSPALYQEATVVVGARQAIVLGDAAFQQESSVYEESPAVFKALTRSVALKDRLGCPVSFPVAMSNRQQMREWRDKVLQHQGWDIVWCCHLQPVVDDGRRKFAQCFDYLDS